MKPSSNPSPSKKKKKKKKKGEGEVRIMEEMNETEHIVCIYGNATMKLLYN
jgi:hypothetical protein